MSSIDHLGAELGRIESVKEIKKIREKNRISSVEKSGKADEILEISDKSVSLENIADIIKGLPDISEDRIELLAHLKQQIKDGTYKVDSEKTQTIAEQLLFGKELGLKLFNS